MSVVAVKPFGRWGNQLFQYAYARAYAEQHNCDFECDEWLGTKIFELNDKPVSKQLPQHSEVCIEDGMVDFEFKGYAQSQKCMIYTKDDLKRFFKPKPQWDVLYSKVGSYFLAHRRVGDYLGYGYPVVSEKSYVDASNEFCSGSNFLLVQEERSFKVRECNEAGLEFLPDFFRLCNASTLLRGNSSFSWWAATLGGMLVYSPIVEGLGAGEHHCKFVEGNHPRFCNLSFVTDLYLKQ